MSIYFTPIHLSDNRICYLADYECIQHIDLEHTYNQNQNSFISLTEYSAAIDNRTVKYDIKFMN